MFVRKYNMEVSTMENKNMFAKIV